MPSRSRKRRACVNSFVEKFCEKPISTNGLTERVSARVRGASQSDSEWDSNLTSARRDPSSFSSQSISIQRLVHLTRARSRAHSRASSSKRVTFGDTSDRDSGGPGTHRRSRPAIRDSFRAAGLPDDIGGLRAAQAGQRLRNRSFASGRTPIRKKTHAHLLECLAVRVASAPAPRPEDRTRART